MSRKRGLGSGGDSPENKKAGVFEDFDYENVETLDNLNFSLELSPLNISFDALDHSPLNIPISSQPASQPIIFSQQCSNSQKLSPSPCLDTISPPARKVSSSSSDSDEILFSYKGCQPSSQTTNFSPPLSASQEINLSLESNLAFSVNPQGSSPSHQASASSISIPDQSPFFL